MIVHGQVQGGSQAVWDRPSWNGPSTMLPGNCFRVRIWIMPYPGRMICLLFQEVFSKKPVSDQPLGAKGTGEIGAVAGPPAIVHAVIDALAEKGLPRLICLSNPKNLGMLEPLSL